MLLMNPKRVTCLLGLVVLGSSCSHDTEPAASVAGAYGLHSVNGSALPIFGLQADTLYLNNDGSVRRFFLQNGTGTVYPAAGTYSVSGSDIAFTSYSSAVPHSSPSAQGSADGTYDGASIILNRDGDVLVYAKRK